MAFLSQLEYEALSMNMKISSPPTPGPEWFFGQKIRIISGPFVDFTGEIYEIHMNEKKLRVYVDFMGRKTPVELDFSQVESMDKAD